MYPDHYDHEARGDEGARNLQFESFPVGCSMWRKQQDPTVRARAKTRRHWCLYVECRYDEQRIWVQRGPMPMLYCFSRNWRIMTFLSYHTYPIKPVKGFRRERLFNRWEQWRVRAVGGMERRERMKRAPNTETLEGDGNEETRQKTNF